MLPTQNNHIKFHTFCTHANAAALASGSQRCAELFGEMRGQTWRTCSKPSPDDAVVGMHGQPSGSQRVPNRVLEKENDPPRHPDITCTWSLQKPRMRCSTSERTCPVTFSHLRPLEHGPTRMHFICRGRRGGGSRCRQAPEDGRPP